MTQMQSSENLTVIHFILSTFEKIHLKSYWNLIPFFQRFNRSRLPVCKLR